MESEHTTELYSGIRQVLGRHFDLSEMNQTVLNDMFGDIVQVVIGWHQVNSDDEAIDLADPSA